MRLPRVKMTVRRWMGLVAVVGVFLGVADTVRMSLRASKYREIADRCEQLEHRCREIDAMDPVTRAREAEAAWDDPYLDNPAWNHEMISYWAEEKRKFRDAAANPRLPLPRMRPRPSTRLSNGSIGVPSLIDF
jgi:hypothetical protein